MGCHLVTPMHSNLGALCPPVSLAWSGRVPRNVDLYYHADQGLKESTYVYIQGNHLPQRFAECRSRFTVGEVGFGTGLNFCNTVRVWRECAPDGAHLRYIAFEPQPLNPSQIAYALGEYPELASSVARMLAIYPPLVVNHYCLHFASDVVLELHWYPLQRVSQSFIADAWFYDGFAPACDAQSWNNEAMRQVAAHSGRGTTMATFSAAGQVRRGLEASGFAVKRVAGFGHKRHMLQAQYQDSKLSKPLLAMDLAVIGGGLAGCALALRVAENARWAGRPITITLFERRKAPAERASRNQHAVLFAKVPWLAGWKQQWMWRCWCESVSFLSLHPDVFTPMHKTLSGTGKRFTHWWQGWKNTYRSRAHGHWMTIDDELKAITLLHSGVVDIQALARLMAQRAEALGARVLTQARVLHIDAGKVRYQYNYQQHTRLFTHVVVATNSATSALMPLSGLHVSKGQINRLATALPLGQIYAGAAAYVAPVGYGEAECGGCFATKFSHLRPSADQGWAMWDQLGALYAKRDPSFASGMEQIGQWVDLRSSGRDHAPLVGEWRHPLYVHTGFGGKGSLVIVPASGMLAESIVTNQTSIPEGLLPTRL